MDETSLLQEYTQTQSEEAFANLVEHHTDWVFGYCLRRLKDQEQAEEATHVVFIVLSRKAKSIPTDRPLASWLFKTAQFTVAQMQRTERRKRNLEEKARTVARPSITNEPSSAAKPTDMLDKALETLKNTDREAILLRFYENKSLRETGNMLKISEAAAQKRVDRAVERLHQYFNEQGAVLSLVGLTGMLSSMSAEHARADLAASIVKLALGKTAAAGTAAGANTIAKGVMKTMFWQQYKTPAIIASLAIAGGTAAMAVSLQNNTVTPLGTSRPAQNTPALTEKPDPQREQIKTRLAAIAAKLEQPQSQPLNILQQQFAAELDAAGALGFRVLNQDILSSLRGRNAAAAARLTEIIENLDHDGLHLDDQRRWKPFGKMPMKVVNDTLEMTVQNPASNSWQMTGLFYAQPFDLNEYNLSLKFTAEAAVKTDHYYLQVVSTPIEATDPDEAMERAFKRASAQMGTHDKDKPMPYARYRYEFLMSSKEIIVRENGRIISRGPTTFTRTYLAIQAGAKGLKEPLNFIVTDVVFSKKGVGTPLDDF